MACNNCLPVVGQMWHFQWRKKKRSVARTEALVRFSPDGKNFVGMVKLHFRISRLNASPIDVNENMQSSISRNYGGGCASVQLFLIIGAHAQPMHHTSIRSRCAHHLLLRNSSCVFGLAPQNYTASATGRTPNLGFLQLRSGQQQQHIRQTA